MLMLSELLAKHTHSLLSNLSGGNTTGSSSLGTYRTSLCC